MKEKFTILSVGTLGSKNHTEECVRAALELEKRGVSFEWLFVGPGELDERWGIPECPKSLWFFDRLTTSDLEMMYETADLFVLFSEGPTNALRYALSKGMPSIGLGDSKEPVGWPYLGLSPVPNNGSLTNLLEAMPQLIAMTTELYGNVIRHPSIDISLVEEEIYESIVIDNNKMIESILGFCPKFDD